MGQIFRERIAQAEAMARADMLRLQPEVCICSIWLILVDCSPRPIMLNIINFSTLQSRLLGPDPLLSPLVLESPPKGLDFE